MKEKDDWQYLLLLGSNLGDRKEYLKSASKFLTESCTILSESSLYSSAAWGNPDQQDFFNQALIIETYLEPLELLAFAKKIESDIGRKSKVHWGPREIDIDLLMWSGGSYAHEKLTIPHPFLPERAFALLPSYEIAAQWIDSGRKKSVTEMINDCRDPLEVHIFEFY